MARVVVVLVAAQAVVDVTKKGTSNVSFLSNIRGAFYLSTCAVI